MRDVQTQQPDIQVSAVSLHVCSSDHAAYVLLLTEGQGNTWQKPFCYRGDAVGAPSLSASTVQRAACSSSSVLYGTS